MQQAAFEAKINEVCGPLGADVVFECAGIPATIDQSVGLAKRGGVVSMVGLANLPAEIAPGIRARLDGISDSVSLVNNRAPDPQHFAEVVADLHT